MLPLPSWIQESGPRGNLEDDEQRKLDAQRDTLSKWGVHLSEDHFDGYLYRGERPKRAPPPPPKAWQPDAATILSATPRRISLQDWSNAEVEFELRQGIAYITLNRPSANNAMNETVTEGLRDAVELLKSRADIRVAVLTGRGRMFCAGGDPKAFQAAQAAAGVLDGGFGGSGSGKSGGPRELAQLFLDFAALPQFTICCANGSAMGGGVGLLCVSDFVVAVRNAHFVLSEVKLGVIPATISPHVIARVGAANAKRLFCAAETCNAQRAKEVGLVHEIVADYSGFPAAIEAAAARVQCCAPGALAATKKALIEIAHQPLGDNLLCYASLAQGRARSSAEALEGFRAAKENRAPAWAESAIDVRR